MVVDGCLKELIELGRGGECAAGDDDRRHGADVKKNVFIGSAYAFDGRPGSCGRLKFAGVGDACGRKNDLVPAEERAIGLFVRHGVKHLLELAAVEPGIHEGVKRSAAKEWQESQQRLERVFFAAAA